MSPRPILPPALASTLSAWTWQRIVIGESRASVFRLTKPGEPDLILKTAARDHIFSMQGEAARLHWLKDRAPVPEVIDFVQDPTRDFLLLQALPGADAATVKLPLASIVDLLADALRQLHSVPVHDCPFAHSIDHCITEARARLNGGQIDLTHLEPVNLGRPPADLFSELINSRPTAEAAVFTHGDYCLPNVMIDGERLSGFIDVGHAGIGDPYRDLALVDRSLDRNVGANWTERFFHRYGLANPDPSRLKYFRLLDEFF